MKFINYLNEFEMKKKKWTVISLFNLPKEIRHKLWDMYVDTYQSIGLHIDNPEKLTSKYKISWLIDVDIDNLPDAFIIYKETKYGNKLALMGSDGGVLSKKLLILKMLSLLRKSDWYCEASHKIADILIKNKINIIKDINIIKKVLNKSDVISTKEEGVYKRKIGTLGIVKKMLFGNIKIKE